MITPHLHSETHIALSGTYDHREQIKALAGRPDVQWNGEAHRWLINVGLIPKLYEALGDYMAPASPDFWMTCPLHVPSVRTPRRRSKQQIMADKKQDAQAAGRWGAAIVGLMHGGGE